MQVLPNPDLYLISAASSRRFSAGPDVSGCWFYILFTHAISTWT